MGKSSGDTIDYYILPNKFLCNILGMWPSDKERSTCEKIKACLHFLFSVISIYVIIVPQIIILAIKWNDLQIFAGAGCFTVSLSQILFKLLYLMARRNSAHKLYTELKSLWYFTVDPVERQSYEEFAYWARSCTITFSWSVFGTVIIFLISATYDYIVDANADVTGSNRHLPYDVCKWTEFIITVNFSILFNQPFALERGGLDFIDSPEFEIIFVSQVVASLVCCFVISGLDSTCMTIVLHISGQFRLISRLLSNIEMKYDPTDLRICPENVVTDLVRCIRHHQRIIKLVNDVNSLLTPIIFLQILTSSIVFCLSGYAILSNATADIVLKFASYILAMIIQLLMWCLPGEILVQESLEIGYSAYLNVPWYMLPPIYRRKLCLIVLRSQKYCCISALFFNSISIYTLTNVLNTAFSYFALLRQVQD